MDGISAVAVSQEAIEHIKTVLAKSQSLKCLVELMDEEDQGVTLIDLFEGLRDFSEALESVPPEVDREIAGWFSSDI